MYVCITRLCEVYVGLLSLGIFWILSFFTYVFAGFLIIIRLFHMSPASNGVVVSKDLSWQFVHWESSCPVVASITISSVAFR
jgi:hypothetical protein